MVISVAKQENLTTPPYVLQKIPGKNILKKIIYISRTKRMVILRAKQENLTTPLCLGKILGQRIALTIFSHMAFF
jgi:hypothetical protein